MLSADAVFKPAEAVVAPWPREKNAARFNTLFTGENAVLEKESLFLSNAVRRCRNKADLSCVSERAELAILKNGISAAEDEIHRTFNPAGGEVLPEKVSPPQFRRQKSVIPPDQIRRKRPEEKRILRGAQCAPFHPEGVSAHT